MEHCSLLPQVSLFVFNPTKHFVHCGQGYCYEGSADIVTIAVLTVNILIVSMQMFFAHVSPLSCCALLATFNFYSPIYPHAQ